METASKILYAAAIVIMLLCGMYLVWQLTLG